jgi:hypothetical protein
MDRRGFLRNVFCSLIAAPAIVRAASLMPVRALPTDNYDDMLDLLSRRIDATHKAMAEAMRRSLCSGMPYDGPAIVDSPYVRFSSYETLSPEVLVRPKVLGCG